MNEKESMEKSVINRARLQSCVMIEAVKVYLLTEKYGKVYGYGLVPEGKSAAKMYKALLDLDVDIKFVYRATPPQWN